MSLRRSMLNLLNWLNELFLNPAKERRLSPGQRLQHFNTTYPHIVGRNMLRTFDLPVTYCATEQTYGTCCTQQWCSVLRWLVAIVWQGLWSIYGEGNSLGNKTYFLPLVLSRAKEYPWKVKCCKNLRGNYGCLWLQVTGCWMGRAIKKGGNLPTLVSAEGHTYR